MFRNDILPSLLIPKELESIFFYKPQLPQKPIEPKVPIAPMEVSGGNNYYEITAAFLFFFTVPTLCFEESRGYGVLMFFLFIFLVIKAYKENTRYEDYIKQNNMYKSNIYAYPQRLKEYNIKLAQYNKEIERINSFYYIEECRINKVNDLLKKTILPFESDNIKVIKRGKFENKFYEYLIEYFNDRISTEKCIPINFNGVYYYPDFVYWNNENNLLIDIEIDEPYEIETGMPIHYLGKDDYRNEKITGSGWLIIRFSEDQIINEPTQCCEFIRYVISKVNSYDLITSSDYNNTEISKLRRWTKDEAH